MSHKSNQIVAKLHEQLRDAGWYDLLNVFLVSDDFHRIVERLEQLVADGLRFTPPLRQLFQPFALCPPDALRVVVLAQGPHNRLGVADGLALSAAQPARCPDELSRLLYAIQQEFEQDVPGNPGLSRWATQGVLLLNESLTTQLERDASHVGLWNPFVQYVCDRIATAVQPRPFWVFYGLDPWWESQAGPSDRCYFPQTPDALALALRAVNIRLGTEGREPILW